MFEELFFLFSVLCILPFHPMPAFTTKKKKKKEPNDYIPIPEIINGMADYQVELGTWDYILSATLLAYVTGVSIHALLTQESNVTNYLLAGKKAKWWVVGCSLFSYGTGVEYIGMMVSDGATVGISGSIAMWGSIPPLLVLGYILYGEYVTADIITLPTFLYKSFNKQVRVLYTFFSLVLSVTKIAVSLHYTSELLEGLLGINPTASKIIFITFIEAYTMVGGLRAIMSTEVVQTILLLILSSLLMSNTVSKAGGYNRIKQTLPQNYTKLVHSGYDKNSPWQGLLFGFPVEALVHWCCDQVLTQKALASKNEFNAKIGCCLCCILNIIPPFLFVLSGMAVKASYLQQPDHLAVPDPDDSLMFIISTQMPYGSVGIFISVLLCSLVTSVASVLTACSAIVTVDVVEANIMMFKNCRGSKGQQIKIALGRVSCLCVGLLGLGWSFVLPELNRHMDRYMMDSSTFSAAILTAFLCAFSFASLYQIKSYSISIILFIGILLGSLRITLVGMEESTPKELEWYRDVNHYSLTAVLFVAFLGIVFLLNKIRMSSSWNIMHMSQLTSVRSVVGSVVGSTDSDDELDSDNGGTPLAPPDCSHSDYGSTYQATLAYGGDTDQANDHTCAATTVADSDYSPQHLDVNSARIANALAALCFFAFLALVIIWF